MRRPMLDDYSMQSFIRVDPAVVRNVMQQVYLWMTMAMLTTALTAFITLNIGLTDELINSPLYLVALLGELGLVVFLSARIHKMSASTAITMFFAYSALNGVTMSLILLIYTTGSIVSAFVSAGALFAAMSIVGATTTMDLTKMGTYLIMGVIGLLVALIVNMFLGSTQLDLLISAAGVLIFTGLTAYDTQRIARMAGMVGSGDNTAVTRVAIMGALRLYLDFINLFLFILRLVGRRR